MADKCKGDRCSVSKAQFSSVWYEFMPAGCKAHDSEPASDCDLRRAEPDVDLLHPRCPAALSNVPSGRVTRAVPVQAAPDSTQPMPAPGDGRAHRGAAFSLRAASVRVCSRQESSSGASANTSKHPRNLCDNGSYSTSKRWCREVNKYQRQTGEQERSSPRAEPAPTAEQMENGRASRGHRAVRLEPRDTQEPLSLPGDTRRGSTHGAVSQQESKNSSPAPGSECEQRGRGRWGDPRAPSDRQLI